MRIGVFMEKGISQILKGLNERGKHPFITEIEKGLLAQERLPKARDYFYAGQSGQCRRCIQAAINNTIPYHPMEFRSRRAFEYGTCAHERYQNALKIVDPDCIAEMPLRFTIGDVTVSGKIDLITKLAGHNKKEIVEFKTMSGTEFKSLKAPKHDHLCQWNTYSYKLELYNGLIIYESKDDKAATGLLPELKVFEVNFSKELFDETIGRFADVVKCNRLKTIADRDTPCTNYFCEVGCDKKGKASSVIETVPAIEVF
jgi:hypothetical protein